MSGYLVEIMAGEERLYHTLLAFRDAIQAGEITPESRIYHRAAARWIPITEHPEYRRHLAERRPPDWLDPIPFEPAQPLEPHDAPHGLRNLVAKLERAGATVRGWFARRPPPTVAPRDPVARPSPPRSLPPTPPASPDSEAGDPAQSQQKGWTFLS